MSRYAIGSAVVSPTETALFTVPNPAIDTVDLVYFVDPKVNTPVKEKAKAGEARMAA
jgi:hypothetical protein